jgi:inner membrane protein
MTSKRARPLHKPSGPVFLYTFGDMDTLTHALSGALLARATQHDTSPLPRRTRMWVGFWAAAFPDGDFVLRFIDPLIYLTTHRGITHSVLLLPLWALGLAVAFMWISRRRYSWRAFAGVCALGIGAHILGDVITAFGTMIFAPFSDVRVSFPYTFIIDPYFSAIIIAGLVGAALLGSRRFAVGALLVLVAYVGAQAWWHQRAIDIGVAYAARAQLTPATVHALPQPFSPLHWMVVIEQPDAYHLSYVDLWRGQTRSAAPGDPWWYRIYASYRPADALQWATVWRFGDSPADARLARELWNDEVLADYRRFAMLPALYRIDRKGDSTCVWFNDLRFAMAAGRDNPFRYGACRGQNAWRVYQLAQEQRYAVGAGN